MERVERLTNLVAVLLDTRVPLTITEILDRVPGYPAGEAARQAFERDKRVLREEGVPVETEAIEGQDQVGYRIPPDRYYLPDLDLSEDERIALHLALAGVHLEGGEGRGEALWKLGSAAPVDVTPLAALPALPELVALHDAHRRRATVTFGYKDSGRRRVDLHGLVFRDGFWYAIGHAHDRGEVRTFRVDRMVPPIEVGEPGSYEVPAGADPASVLPRQPWEIGAGEAVVAEVLVDAVLGPQVRAELGPAADVEERADGGLVLRLPVVHRPGFRSWVLGLLDHAEVVGPDDLREEIVAWLEQVAAAAGGAAS